jgi:hypothetical protein
MSIQSNEKGTKISVKLPVPMPVASEAGSVPQRSKSAG